MISALLLVIGPQTAPTLVPDLQAAGVLLKGALETGSKLVQAVAQYQPDVLICDVAVPDKALWKALRNLDQTLPCPVLLFTEHQDAKAMAEASGAGVHVYAVMGYEARRLRALIQLAQARFIYAQEQRQAFEDLSTRFEERKTVDRAKGILMQARQVSDDDAFALLRSAAMRSKQRLGQLSLHIIQSAQAADALNRAGQLRMLSQRLVKLHLLQAAGVQPAHQVKLLLASEQRVDANLALLRKTLSEPTYGDLLDAVEQAWGALRAAMRPAGVGNSQGSEVNAASTAKALEHTQACAEQLLHAAERLTASLESGEAGAPMQVLNLSGRQRMLSQRFAKHALLVALGDPALAQHSAQTMEDTRAAFEKALIYLNGIPLSTPDIHSALQATGVAWLQLLAASSQAAKLRGAAQQAQLQAIATQSEALLQLFEQLAEHYERSMQMLLVG